MSSKSKTTQQSTSTTQQTLDPQYAALIYGNAARAQSLANTPYTPYSGTTVAGFTPAQLQAQQMLTDIGTNKTGADTLASAVTAAKSAAGYTPLTVASTPVNGIDRSTIGNVSGGSLADVDLSKYMDPYIGNVVNTTTSALEQQRLRDLNTSAQNATLAGAWRGDRQGVADALTNEAAGNTLASTVANLYSQGFNTATANAEQDLSRGLTAQQANQGADLSVAGTNNATALANAAAALDAAKSNQGAGLTASAQSLASAGTLAGLSNDELQQAGTRASLVSAAGDAQQQQAQAQLEWLYQNNYVNKQDYEVAMQQLLNQSLGLVPATGTTTNNSSGTSTTKTSPGLTGILGGIGSLFSGLGAAGFAIPSDAALKLDVRTVEHDAKGRRWVDFRYLWDAPGVTHRGLIAQEVARTDPDAVSRHPLGFLMVDYSRLAA